MDREEHPTVEIPRETLQDLADSYWYYYSLEIEVSDDEG